MGFMTPAFIRRNTSELRKKLEELGYRLFGEELNEDLCIFTSPECGLYNIEFFSNIPHPEETDSIDCGDNEELFLSIASLRDDTNENQWFTNGEEWAYHPKTECCSPCTTMYKTLAFDSIPKNTNMGNYHKATVEELIEHFKGKEVNHG